MNLLDAFEQGDDRGPVEKALLLLELASAVSDRGVLEALPIGERDARLFELRRSTFGSSLPLVATCRACGERIEASLDVDAVLAAADRDTAATLQVEGTGRQLTVRRPTSADLVAAGTCSSEAEAGALMLARAIAPVLPADLEATEFVRIEAALERHDVGDVEIAFACDACSLDFVVPFDIVSYLWREMGVACERLLDDVHLLARAYGWREQDVLALSPRRRRAYVERVLG